MSNIGTVKWFNSRRGDGFIIPENKKPEDKDIFVHVSALHRINLDRLDEGQIVEYETYDDRGRIAADIINLLGFAKRR